MNQVLVMAIKDLRLLFRDKLGAFFIIGFPILMGIFFGMVMGGPSSGSGPGQNENSNRRSRPIHPIGQVYKPVGQQRVDRAN